MRVTFCSDDDNECTRAVLAHLAEVAELRVVERSSWPAMAMEVGRAVTEGTADFGVVMCWTGTGSAIAANKVKGVRAAQAW